MIQQDFTKKIVIVLNRELENWQALNSVAHIAAYLGNKMKERFDTGEYFTTKDKIQYPRNSQYPIIILSAKPGQLPNLFHKVKNSGLLFHVFIQEMIDTTDDNSISTVVSQKTEAQMKYLGVGIFGENDSVTAITKNYSLWK